MIFIYILHDRNLLISCLKNSKKERLLLFSLDPKTFAMMKIFKEEVQEQHRIVKTIQYVVQIHVNVYIYMSYSDEALFARVKY